MKSKSKVDSSFRLNRTAAFLLLIAMLVVPLSSVADVSEVEEFDFDLNAGGSLSIENVNGDINVSAGPDGKVRIKAYKKADDRDYLDEIEIKISASDDRIRIRTELPSQENRWFGFGNSSGSVSYEIVVPADTNIDEIDTVNGEIDVSGINGDVSADTTNGDIHLTGLRGNLEADTVNGGIDASFDVLGGNQRVVADTVNGRIYLRLPADASAEVEAGTVNGGIDADDFGLTVDKGFLGRDLDGEIGGGDARVKLGTVNGSIKIRKN